MENAKQAPNLEGLKQYQQEKRADTLKKVRDAIDHLQANGLPIHFKSVAEISGITRKTLYKVEELKTMVREYRGDLLPEDKDSVIAGQAVAIKVMEEEMRKLREELAKTRDKTDAIRELKQSLAARLRA